MTTSIEEIHFSVIEGLFDIAKTTYDLVPNKEDYKSDGMRLVFSVWNAIERWYYMVLSELSDSICNGKLIPVFGKCETLLRNSGGEPRLVIYLQSQNGISIIPITMVKSDDITDHRGIIIRCIDYFLEISKKER